jgi:hypothetical protein
MRVTYLLASLIMQRIGPQVFEALELLDRLVESPDADTGALDGTTKLLDDAFQIERTLTAYTRAAERSGTAVRSDGTIAQFSERLQDLLQRTLSIRVHELHKSGGEPDEKTVFLHDFFTAAASGQAGLFIGDRLATVNKSCGFLTDVKFSTAFARNAGHAGEERGRAWRLHTLTWAAQHALKLEGDFVECGVFEGFMSSTVCEYVDFALTGKTFYLYDTFEGFSPKYSSPLDFGIHRGFYELAQNTYRRPGLYESVVERFRSFPNVKIIRGVVPDSLRQECPDGIAYCHIDLNSPAAEVGALDVLFEHIVPGGMIVLDDYGWLPFAKQKEAEDAFAERRGYSILVAHWARPDGQTLIGRGRVHLSPRRCSHAADYVSGLKRRRFPCVKHEIGMGRDLAFERQFDFITSTAVGP